MTMTLHGQVQDPPSETAGVEAWNPLKTEAKQKPVNIETENK